MIVFLVDGNSFEKFLVVYGRCVCLNFVRYRLWWLFVWLRIFIVLEMCCWIVYVVGFLRCSGIEIFLIVVLSCWNFVIVDLMRLVILGCIMLMLKFFFSMLILKFVRVCEDWELGDLRREVVKLNDLCFVVLRDLLLILL